MHSCVVCCLLTFSCSIMYSFAINCVLRLWGSYPTEPMTCEAHPFFFQVKESRRTHILPLVWVSGIVESGPRHQQSNCSYLWSPGGLSRAIVLYYGFVWN
ncbi:hypothetical protein Taro_047769 [Colocasia esculenta]|uniref:Secreted protein n=1 Tax=Colocasia esculenta TaxID=4460 RepID=A0A843X7F3_COLES|nr:hypothetical protein [Colocasia esculenta]